jgi:hypothetical protein
VIGLRLTRDCHWSWRGTYRYVDPADIHAYEVHPCYADHTTVWLKDGSGFLTIETPARIARLIERNLLERMRCERQERVAA